MPVTFNVYNPNDDSEAMLVIHLTHEGLIIDMFDESGETMLKTWSATSDEIAESFFVGGDSTLVLADPDNTKGE